MFATPSAIISTVVLLACIVAIVCAAVAISLAKPMSVNAAAIREMRLNGRLKIAKGGDPVTALRDYLEAKARLTHVDDASQYPPHPSINNLMGLANDGNPSAMPSDVAERNTSEVCDASEINSLRVPQHQRSRIDAATGKTVDLYLGAVTGKKVKDRMSKIRREVMDDPDDKELFEKIFGISEVVHHSTLIADGDAPDGRKTDIDLLAYNSAGHCSQPIKAVPGKTCSQICFSSRAVRIEAPFIAGGSWVNAGEDEDESREYCWAGKSAAVEKGTDNATIGTYTSREGDRLLRPCSRATASLVLTDDGGWQCRPRYPTYFGGSDGTVRTSCRFDPSAHKGPAEVYNNNVSYIDVLSRHRIKDHNDFSMATFLRIIRSAKNVATYKRFAYDTELLYTYPVVCDCDGQLDTMDNPLLDTEDRKRMKFIGMYHCLDNPCYMVPDISPDFGEFNAREGTCVKYSLAPTDAVNIILGDERTPLAGAVPAMGLMVADHSRRPDNVLTQSEFLNYDEPTAKEIGRASAPVVTAKNLDSSNASRNVLYVPIPSMVLPKDTNIPTAVVRPSAIMHMDCMPPMLVKPSALSARPFCTAAFYVEPAANVTAGHVPQKPYEHNLLVTECLRNSRMVSGNILGGSEMLFSALLSRDSVALGGGRAVVADPTPGDSRIDDIRDVFDRNFGNSRRLSTFEYLVKREEFGGGTDSSLDAARVYDEFTRWDKEFRREDFNRTGINSPRESFVIREGLLMRSYGPYAATVLAPNSFDFRYMRGDSSVDTPSAVKALNPLQFAFPTSYSILPKPKAHNDIFSTDTTRIFNSTLISSFFNADQQHNRSQTPKLFSDTMAGMNHYRVDTDDDAWGLQTFRLDYDPHSGPAVSSDPRLVFNSEDIDATPTGATLTPLSLFKKTPVEWGHPEADIQKSNWFRGNIDTTNTYRRLLVETSMVLRNVWFSAAWENDNYFFVRNDD